MPTAEPTPLKKFSITIRVNPASMTEKWVKRVFLAKDELTASELAHRAAKASLDSPDTYWVSTPVRIYSNPKNFRGIDLK